MLYLQLFDESEGFFGILAQIEKEDGRLLLHDHHVARLVVGGVAHDLNRGLYGPAHLFPDSSIG